MSRSHYLDDLERELPVDYAFLDEDDEVDYNSVDGGYSLTSMRRRRRSAECESCVKTGAHIVYKRIDVSEDHDSDYSECQNICSLKKNKSRLQPHNISFLRDKFRGFCAYSNDSRMQ